MSVHRCNTAIQSDKKFKTFESEKEELGLTRAAKKIKKVKASYFDKLNSAFISVFVRNVKKSCPVTGQIL